MQVSLVGDFDPEDVEKAFLEFMGTIPAREDPLPLPHLPITFNTEVPVSERHTVRHLSRYQWVPRCLWLLLTKPEAQAGP